jgi:hypothetical protein
VKATRYFTQEDDGLRQVWHGRVFLNPPGGLVREFWMALMLAWRDKNIEQAVWIGYSLEQLQTLQACPLSPLNFPMCVTAKRIAFIENEAKRVARIQKLTEYNMANAAIGGKLRRISERAGSPSHSNYITYLGPNTQAFVREFSQFGQVR